MSDIKAYYDSQKKIMAILIPVGCKNEGVRFLTSDEENMQLAVMGHKSGEHIIPHYHNRIVRTIDNTCETLIVRNGVLRVDLYENKERIHSFEVSSGDIVTLFSGGHGFEVIESVDMIEIKQGPFVGANDKVRF